MAEGRPASSGVARLDCSGPVRTGWTARLSLWWDSRVEAEFWDMRDELL